MKKVLASVVLLLLLFSCNTVAMEEKMQVRFSETLPQTESAGGYISPSVRTVSRSSTMRSARSLLGASAYPAQYDSRGNGWISAPGDQGTTELCWAFSTTAAAQAYVAKTQQETVDYSENHMKYSTSSGNGNTLGFERAASDGGNSLISVSYLARGTGFVPESEDPFTTAVTARTPQQNDQRYQQGYLQDADMVSYASVEEAKSMIQNYGAVSAALYYNDYYCKNNLEGDTAYYYAGAMEPNHMVTLIGWDDHYQVSRFKSGYRPTEDGAFLAQNSWGNDWGDGGYFYISYEDIYVLSSLCGIAYSNDSAPYDGIRQYDYFGMNGYVMVDSGVQPFYAAAYDTGDASFVSGIGTYTLVPDTRLEIYVNPCNGNAGDSSKFRLVYQGLAGEAGYHYIAFDPQALYGERFTVAVRIVDQSGMDYRVVPTQGADTVVQNTSFQPNTFYLGTALQDLTAIEQISGEFKDSKVSLCLKAFTNSDLSFSCAGGSAALRGDRVQVTLSKNAAGAVLSAKRNGNALALYQDAACTQSVSAPIAEGQTYYVKLENGTHRRYAVAVARSDKSDEAQLLAFRNATWNEGAGVYFARSDTAFSPDTVLSGGAQVALYCLPGGVGAVSIPFSGLLYQNKLYLRVTAEDGFTAKDYPLIVAGSFLEVPLFRDAAAVSPWATDALLETAKRGIFHGDQNVNFLPQNNLSRSEAAVIMLRGSGINTTYMGYQPYFADVSANSWFNGAAATAQSMGIIKGNSDQGYRCFYPDRAVSRQEFAAMMVRLLAQEQGLSEQAFLTQLLPAANARLQQQPYADLQTVASWARDSFAVALYLGIFNGSAERDGKLYLYPDRSITREESCRVMANSLKLVEKF